MTTKVRFATANDLETIVEMGSKFFELHPYKTEGSEYDHESTLKTVSDLLKDQILLVLEVDGKVEGMAGAIVVPCYWNFYEKQGVENFWWVNEEHRKGNGKRLRQALEKIAKARGAKYWVMVSLTTAEPEKLHKMYAKAGFNHIENVYMKVL